MTILTLCECDGCGDRLPTPQGDGSDPFEVISVTVGSSASGGPVQSFEGHLCPQCIIDLRRSLDVSRWPRPRRPDGTTGDVLPFRAVPFTTEGGGGAAPG